MLQILLIMSSAYCNAELQAEFGKVPAALIPNGSKTLLVLQLEQLKHNKIDEIYVTVPNDLDASDLPCLGPIRLSPDLSVEDAIFQALVYINRRQIVADYRIHVIHGDTWISKLFESDGVGSVEDDGVFKWKSTGSNRLAYNGYFSTTKQNLIRHGFQMHAILDSLPPVYMGAKNIECYEWKDYGHVSTYWNSRASCFATRHFNNLLLKNNFLVKSGERNKILGEVDWFYRLPLELKFYAPATSRLSVNSYAIEYLPMPSLAEIWVHGNRPVEWWQKVLSKCDQFLSTAHRYQPSVKLEDPLLLQKALNRYKQAPKKSSLVLRAVNHLKKLQPKQSIVHGDLCFSNILYDSRRDAIKVIDPRGLGSQGQKTIYGSVLYDLAKLFHSVVGGYDFIVARKTPKQTPDELKNFILRLAEAYGFSNKDLYLMTGLLFTAMYPLHSDDLERAKKLYDRGLQLLEEGFKCNKKISKS